MDQIKGMTPEQKKTADFMGLGGKNTQSKQTMDILKQLTGEQESDKLLDFRTKEGQRNRNQQTAMIDKRFGNQKALKKLTEGTPLNATETKGILDGLKVTNQDIVLKRSQMEKTKDPKAKAWLFGEIQDMSRQISMMEKLLNPDFAKGVETEQYKTNIPSGYDIKRKLKPQTYRK